MQTISIGDTFGRIQTDEHGRFELRYLEPGTYAVSIEGKGVLKDERFPVEVKEAEVTGGQDFRAEVGETLTCDVERIGAAHVVILVLHDEEGNRVGDKTSRGGAAVFDGLKPGRYTLDVDFVGAPGAEPADIHLPVEVKAGGRNRVRVTPD